MNSEIAYFVRPSVRSKRVGTFSHYCKILKTTHQVRNGALKKAYTIVPGSTTGHSVSTLM